METNEHILILMLEHAFFTQRIALAGNPNSKIKASFLHRDVGDKFQYHKYVRGRASLEVGVDLRQYTKIRALLRQSVYTYCKLCTIPLTY